MKHVSYSNIVYVCVCVIALVLSSCRPGAACRENLQVGWVCEFKYPYYDKNAQQHITTTWDSITVIGMGQAEPLYDNAKNVSKLTLPVHTDLDSTSYTLLYHNLLDTLCIRHTNQQKFISMECGCIVEHDMVNIRTTNHWITRVEILTDTMRRSGTTNMYIWMEEN